MPNLVLKPTSPGRRNMTRRDFSTLTAKKPTKSLTVHSTKSGGRNNQGRITVRHIGGGHKQRYRLIDFTRSTDISASVKTIEYDPNRSAHIALIESEQGKKTYILAPKQMSVGDTVHSAAKATVSVGNTMELRAIPTGIEVHNIELTPGGGGKLVRSAGMSATVLAHEGKWATIKLPSAELRRIDGRCRATIGIVSNSSHENTIFGKAGRKRWLGIRPTVRGKAMNPNTHPHGGGEGVNSIGLKKGPKTPWGAPALGRRTRDRNARSNVFIINRREK